MPTPSQHAFSEKVVLVNGGTTPIGRAVALQLALYGAFVIVSHPVGDDALADIDELKSLGTLAATAPFAASGLSGAGEVKLKVEELYGRLDLLVNCTVLEAFGDFASTSEERFSEVLEKSLKSTFFNTRECLGLMMNRPKPKIVNIYSACNGEDSVSDLLLRSVNESIAELTRVLASELPAHFRVNGIRVSEKGSVKEIDKGLDPELFRPKSGVDPDDVARTVLFLLSSEAAGVNGQILDIS